MRAFMMLIAIACCCSLGCGVEPTVTRDAGDGLTDCATLFEPIGQCALEWGSCNNRESVGMACSPAPNNSFDCTCSVDGVSVAQVTYVGTCPLTNPNRDMVEFVNEECGIVFEGVRE